MTPGQPSDALEFGLLVHELLARHYRREDRWALLDEIRSHNYKPDLVDQVDTVFSYYLKEYPRKKDPYYQKVLYKSWIERYVAVVKSGNGHLTTRIDFIYEHKGGIVIVDHKTANAMTAQLTTGFMYDPQILTLALAATSDPKLRKYRLVGVEINAIVRTKKPQFTRVRHKYNTKILKKFLADFSKWAEYLAWAKENGWPRTYACVDKYRKTCEYRDACMLGTYTGLVEAEEGRIL